MIPLIIIACVLLLVVAGLLWIPIRLDVRYRKDALRSGATAYLRILWLKIPLNKKDKPEKDEKSKPEKMEFSGFRDKFQYYTKMIQDAKEDIVAILAYAGEHALKIEKLHFRTEFGFEDPMYTGMATGLINGAVYNVLAQLMRWVSVEEHLIDIRPDFDRTRFTVNFWCIVRVKNVHIIVIAMKILRLVRRVQKIKQSTERE